MGKPTNKQLTNSKFGPWGWSMILYAFLLYYFWAGLSVDALNVYPEAFAALHGWDPNVLLGFATPAGIIGVLGGIGMSQLISKFMDTPTALSVPAILVAVVFSVLIGLIFLIWLAGKGYNTVVNILCRVQHLKEVHFDSVVV